MRKTAKGKFEYWLTDDGLLLLEAWARDGLTDEQIAHNCRINVATLYRWKERYCGICEALKKGKAIIDIEVENSLLKRALGYEYTEVKVKRSPDGTEVTETLKVVPPDVTAPIYWLKNRKRGKWMDKPVDDTESAALTKAKEMLGGVDSAF